MGTSNNTGTDPLYGTVIMMLPAAVIFFQGSYFPYQYLTISILLCLLILNKMKKLALFGGLNYHIIATLFLLVFIYLLSTIIVASNKYMAALETLKLSILPLSYLAVAFDSDRQRMLKGILTGCMAVAVVGILAYLKIVTLPGAILVSEGDIRLQSTFQYANITGLFMGIGYFLSLYFMEASHKFRDKQKYYLYGNVFFVSLILTLSRGALAAFGVSLIILCIMVGKMKTAVDAGSSFVFSSGACTLLNRMALVGGYLLDLSLLVLLTALMFLFIKIRYKYERRVNKYAAITFLLLFLTLAAAVVYGKGLDRIFRFSPFEGTLIERYIYVKDALGAVMDNPYLGIGPGGWISRQFFYQTAQYAAKYVHNGMIQFALDAGIGAFMLFTAFLIMLYRNMIAGLKSGKSFLKAVIFSCVTLIVIHSAVDITLSFPSVLMVLALFTAIVSPGYDDGMKCSGQIRPALATTATIVLSFTVIFSSGYLAGQLLFQNADFAYAQNNYERAAGLYRGSIYLRPFDGHPYLQLARCHARMGGERETVLTYLEKACALNSYEPVYLEELAELGKRTQDYRLLYDAAVRLVDLKPLDSSAYEMVLDSLVGMLNRKLIDPAGVKEELGILVDKIRQANERIDPLSSYMKNQTPVILDDRYLELLD